MLLDTSLQDDVRREIERIQNADRVKVFENTVDTEIVENLHGRATARDFSFDYDEPEYVAGGEGRGPRPLEYFLAGFAFCQQVQYARNALSMGIALDDLSMNVLGRVDPRGSLVEGVVPAGFVDDELQFETHIESSEAPEDVARLAARAQERCHAHASLTRRMTLDGEVYLNGERLDV